MEQRKFKKPFEFNSFSEIFYCGMTRLRNTNLGVFIQQKHTRNILRNEIMGQGLFKKYSKFQKFDEIYCGMTRFRNVKVLVFRQHESTKTILKNENMGLNRFKKLSKFRKFLLSNFTLTWSNEEKRIEYGLI